MLDIKDKDEMMRKTSQSGNGNWVCDRLVIWDASPVGPWGLGSPLLAFSPLHRWQRLIFLELLKMAAIDWRGIILSQGCMVSDQYSYLPICDPSKAALVCNGIIAIIFPWSPKFKGGNANHLKSYFKRWYQVAKIRHTRCWDLDDVTNIVEDTRRYHNFTSLLCWFCRVCCF